jgi:hypothetical protein
MGNELQKQPLGFFTDPQGDFSSGRLIKIFSFVVAVVIGVGVVFAMSFVKDAAVAEQMSDYSLKLVAMFLGTATGAELVQKITKT